MLKMEIELGPLAVHLERNGSLSHIIHKNKLRMYLKNLSIYFKIFCKTEDSIMKLKRHVIDWGKITSTYAVEALSDFHLTDSPY